MSSTLKRVSIGSIRQELEALWASESINDEAILRAQTHNLVVYTSDRMNVEETTRRVVTIAAQHPGRVIVIDNEPGQAPRLETWITTYCRAVGRRQICGELITLGVSDATRDEIHSIVVSLLAPDLPVYVWWVGVPDPDDHLFRRLAEAADRVLVDSDTFVDVAGGLQALSRLEGLRLGDLNWARLTPWRRLVAQVWDMASALDRIKSLDVHHIASGDFQNSARALLMVGWLADCLGWELAEARPGSTGGYITVWRRERWQSKVEIVESTRSGVEPGEIIGVFIQAGAEPPYVMPRLELNPSRGCVETRLDDGSPQAMRLCSSYRRVSTAMALAEEIDFGHDRVYEGALKRAVEIVKGK